MAAPSRARWRARSWAVVGVLAATGLLAGCSGPAGTDAAQRIAQRAVQAAASGDTATLCGLLAPTTAQDLEQQQSAPCPEALRSVDLGRATAVGRAEVWGRSALVPTGSTAVFLTEVDGQWRVLAAGCVLAADRPASCRLGGG